MGGVFVPEKFIVCLIIVILWPATVCLYNNMSVHSKFMHVRCLWNLYACAHTYSLEGALVRIQLTFAVLEECRLLFFIYLFIFIPFLEIKSQS